MKTRVGIVGADNKGIWAKVSHVPAINSVPGLKLAAVATRNGQSAREAAARCKRLIPLRIQTLHDGSIIALESLNL
jgi:predicted dehydrogenase